MGATGTATLDFGAFPGGTDASVAVTGQAGIVSGSRVEAYFEAASTADHGSDEHVMVATVVELVAGTIVPGTGFTIYGVVREAPPATPELGRGQGYAPGKAEAERMHGQFTVAWAWV